jgi:hypothetical protein
VIEVKLIRRATDHTFPAVSLPDRKLHGRGYQSAMLSISLRWGIETLVFLNRNESVLKNLAVMQLTPEYTIQWQKFTETAET